MFTNISGYFYHFIMARMLGTANYGALDSLISLLYILGVPMGTLGLVIVKFSSSFKGIKNISAIKQMFAVITKHALIISFIAFIIFLILVPNISSFLHLNNKASLILIGLIGLVTVFSTINRSFLQGTLNFNNLSLSLVIEAVLKFSLSIVLVLFGLGINGAIIPILVGGIVSYIFTLKVVSRLNQEARVDVQEINFLEMIKYSLPVFLSMLAFTSLYTSDVIMVRHYLNEIEAGHYASISTLGRIIFFATSPIAMVMFPIFSERNSNGKDCKKLLWMSLLVILGVSSLISLIYFLFPKLMINLLFGREFVAAAPFLFPFAIFLSFYSLSYIVTNYFLSIHQIKVIILPIIASILQIILMVFFHKNISEMISVSITVTSLLFVTQMLYYARNKG